MRSQNDELNGKECISRHMPSCEICFKSFKTEEELRIHNTRIYHSLPIYLQNKSTYDSQEKRNQERSNQLHNRLAKFKRSTFVIKRIPKSARICCAFALSDAIDECIKYILILTLTDKCIVHRHSVSDSFSYLSNIESQEFYSSVYGGFGKPNRFWFQI
ncbi:hypothetical protein JTB14_022169 [Gonioctena quinquepunctata]|nr:hypothetical protein JTB14_022169 [Gonioctena quinquepunctata]